jgi:proteasome lid subunit RPN8/RPN11
VIIWYRFGKRIYLNDESQHALTLAMKLLIKREILEAMLSLARGNHPREVIILLRGKREKDAILIEDFLFPPFASSGRGFAQFPPHMLPIDFSIVGTAHSHPSGSPSPSASDLNNFYGRLMMIIAYPYGEENAAAFNSRGENFVIEIA